MTLQKKRKPAESMSEAKLSALQQLAASGTEKAFNARAAAIAKDLGCTTEEVRAHVAQSSNLSSGHN